MTESECLSKMVFPGQRRPNAYMGGIIQVWVTRGCDKSCFHCTQGSNLGGKPHRIMTEQYEQAVISLKDYFGVVGMFGGNPATHPQFPELCAILRKHIPYKRRGLWCNNPLGHGAVMRETFNPSVSNLNVHLDHVAYAAFKRDWPESQPFGLDTDSRHSPPYVALKDVLIRGGMRLYNGVDWPCETGGCQDRAAFVWHGPGRDALYCNRHVYDEAKGWELISRCDVNRNWSAMIGVFRGQLRAWFCEVAGAQSMLHQDEPEYPDTGLDPTLKYEHLVAPGDALETTVGDWWQLGYPSFAGQVRKHCHECGIPLKGHGQLAHGGEVEQVSATHSGIYKPKRAGRPVEVVTDLIQLGAPLKRATDYIGNAKEG